MSSTPCRYAGIAALSCVLSLPVWAQEQQQQPPPSPEQQAPANVSPEEQREIEAAMGKGAQASGQQQQQEPPPSPSGDAGAQGGGRPALSVGNFLDLSFVFDGAAAAFTSDEPLQTGEHDPQERGFNLQGLEMSIRSNVDPYFRFDSNIVLGNEGLDLEEAYVTTTDLPANLQLRAGQFLTRFGRLNPTHPHAWDFSDQPFALGRVFGGEGNRGLGLEASWLAPLPWYVELVGAVTDPRGARSFLGDVEGAGVESPLDFQFTGALKQFFELSEDLSLLWGLSVADGPNALGDGTRTQLLGSDVFLKLRPITSASNQFVSLQAEVIHRLRHADADRLQDTSGYGQLAWHFARRWSTGARYEFGTAARGRGGAGVEDPLDADWTDLRQRVSAVLSFYPTEFSRLRLQGASDLVGWRDRPDYSAFLTLEVAIGAHGAHPF